jgi:hypothetical protein
MTHQDVATWIAIMPKCRWSIGKFRNSFRFIPTIIIPWYFLAWLSAVLEKLENLTCSTVHMVLLNSMPFDCYKKCFRYLKPKTIKKAHVLYAFCVSVELSDWKVDYIIDFVSAYWQYLYDGVWNHIIVDPLGLSYQWHYPNIDVIRQSGWVSVTEVL